MALLSSITMLALAATLHLVAAAPQPVTIGDFLFKPGPGEMGHGPMMRISATSEMKTTATGAGTKSTKTSSASSASSSASKGPIYKENGITCDSLNYDKDAATQWSKAGGDDVVQNLTATFAANGAICPQCFGWPISKCPEADPKNAHYDQNCAVGLKDLSNGRFDTAAARYAHDTELDDLQCDIQIGECSAAPSCTDANGPGSYVVLKSLETLNNLLNNIYNAISDAGNACETQMQQFSSDFAPIPSVTSPALLLSIFGSFIGGIGGIVGMTAPGLGVAIGFAGALGTGVASNTLNTTPQPPTDTSKYLGLIANTTMGGVSAFADGLFKDGEAKWPKAADGSTGVSIATLMQKGDLLFEQQQTDSIRQSLKPIFERSLYQQLAVYTWQHLETKDPKTQSTTNIPFIAFETGNCGPNTGGLGGMDGIIEGLDRASTQVSYKGNCYYLLNAKPVLVRASTPVGGGGNPHANRRGDGTGMFCDGSNVLPGGSNKLLTGDPGTYAGLTLADFVVPSVEGWLQNGKKNGWTPAFKTGNVIDAVQYAGVTSIPVCDYLTAKGNSPGSGCPKLLSSYKGDCKVY